MRYQVEHLKRNAISPCTQLLFSIYLSFQIWKLAPFTCEVCNSFCIFSLWKLNDPLQPCSQGTFLSHRALPWVREKSPGNKVGSTYLFEFLLFQEVNTYCVFFKAKRKGELPTQCWIESPAEAIVSLPSSLCKVLLILMGKKYYRYCLFSYTLLIVNRPWCSTYFSRQIINPQRIWKGQVNCKLPCL